MKRWLLAGAVIAAIATGCSGGAEHPEGIVERWIVSMNQGRAGAPSRWAEDRATATVSPTWHTDDPGSIDAFSIGIAEAEDDAFVVPFTLERLDGTVTSGDVVVARRGPGDAPGGLEVKEVRLGAPSGPTGHWMESTTPGAWLLAIAVAVILTIFTVALVRLVERSTRLTP
jgi:hypothetical protein